MQFPRNPLQQLKPQRILKLRARIEAFLWEGYTPLEVFGGPVNKTFCSLFEARQQSMREVTSGEYFGPAGGGWAQRWFRIELPPPEDYERGRRVLFWECDGETTAYFKGSPWAGLDVAHSYCAIPDEGGELWLDCGTYQTAIWTANPNLDRRYGARFHKAGVALRAPLAWECYWDLDTLVRVLACYLEDAGYSMDFRVGPIPALEKLPFFVRKLLGRLDSACDTFDRHGLQALHEVLKEIYVDFKGNVHEGHVSVVGQAHLDLVWLFPEEVARRKAVHTAATALRLMEQYPEFRFIQSQIPNYDVLRDLAPGLLEEVQTCINEGRWEATGASEVESDVTIPCGEALVRSILYGQQRYAELRGNSSRVFWIPDVFGYSSCVPQILQKTKVPYFFTTKLTWSKVTRFPYNSMVWRGPDGSEVIAYISSKGYNNYAEVRNIIDVVREYQQADVHDEVLLPQGYGDGAGGPNEEICERIRRLKDITGVPNVEWSSVEGFFDRLSNRKDELPVFQGELYLELHRGTFTTQSELKRVYRNAEKALFAWEAVRAVTGRTALTEQEWKRVLFAQFHDALPGTCIAEVNQDLIRQLQEVTGEAWRGVEHDLSTEKDENGEALSVFNPWPVSRCEPVELKQLPGADQDTPLVQDGEGRVHYVQKVCRKDGTASYLVPLELPGLGTVTLWPYAGEAEPTDLFDEVSPRILDNGIVRAVFKTTGHLESLMVEGETLRLQNIEWRIYPDYPVAYDAWDIDRDALSLGTAVCKRMPLQIEEEGPLRAVLKGEGQLGDGSRLTVRYILEAGSEWLKMECTVDWREEHTLLKFHCLTDYRGEIARFGAPFGFTDRLQVARYAEDEGQWEVPAQRWAAVGDASWCSGLSVVTEAKYGFSCRDGDLGLSLLRAPEHPDASADRGEHVIQFALGKYSPSYAGNKGEPPPFAAERLYGSLLPTEGELEIAPPFRLQHLGSLVPVAVKPAESGSGILVRLHETAGARGSAYVHTTPKVKEVSLVNLLEETEKPAPVQRRELYEIPYHPYEIISLYIDTGQEKV